MLTQQAALLDKLMGFRSGVPRAGWTRPTQGAKKHRARAGRRRRPRRTGGRSR